MDEPGRENPAAVPDLPSRGNTVDEPGLDPAAVPGLERPPPKELERWIRGSRMSPLILTKMGCGGPLVRISHQEPTPAQYKFLTDLIEQTGESVPDHVWRWKQAMSAEIDHRKAPRSGDKQRQEVNDAIELDKARGTNTRGGAR